jgi:hypothetical protein
MSEIHPAREYENRLIAAAKATLTRNPDGSFDEEKLITALINIVPFEIEQERRRKAQGIYDRAKRPGATKPNGQLTLPGLEKYNYEPDRLVSDDEGNVIENSRAPPRFKAAETARARLNVQRAVEQLNIKSAETDFFQKWALEQALLGRPALDLTWGNCVTENNLRAAA